MAISFVAAGTAGTGSSAPAPTYPAGLSAGDLLVLAICNKYPTNGPSTPSGWTAPANNQFSGGQGAAGPDRGNVYATIFYKESDGTETGSLTLTITSGNSAVARIFAYRKTTGTWGIACAGGSDNSAGTSWSVTAGSDPGVNSGDMVIAASAVNGANGSQIASVELITQTGVTFGTMAERQDSGTSTNDNSHLVVSEHPVTAGPSSAVPTYTFTSSASGANWPAGATVLMRLREVSAAASLPLPNHRFNHLLVR